ncbi:hypothetical protein EMIT0P218_10396 [Pseudomonas sp. IT-P218]
MASFSSTLMVSRRSMERKINSLALRAARSAIFSMGCMDVSPKVVKESRAFYQKVSTGEGRRSLSWLNGSYSCKIRLPIIVFESASLAAKHSYRPGQYQSSGQYRRGCACHEEHGPVAPGAG